LTLRFRVQSLDWHKKVYFKPLFIFNLTGNGEYRGAAGLDFDSSCLQFNSQDIIYLDREHATLYYRQADPDFIAFFSLFREQEPLFTFQDLELLHKLAVAYGVPVSIAFPPRRVCLKSVLPTPLLRITESSRETGREAVLTLSFRYLNKEVAYETDPPFIIATDEYPSEPAAASTHEVTASAVPPACEVIERQGEFEALVYRALKELVH
jgi:hypothetical protein